MKGGVAHERKDDKGHRRAAAVLGLLATVVGNWVQERTMEITIDEKIEQALNGKENTDEEEEENEDEEES